MYLQSIGKRVKADVEAYRARIAQHIALTRAAMDVRPDVFASTERVSLATHSGPPVPPSPRLSAYVPAPCCALPRLTLHRHRATVVGAHIAGLGVRRWLQEAYSCVLDCDA